MCSFGYNYRFETEGLVVLVSGAVRKMMKLAQKFQQHTQGVVGKLIWILLEIYCSLQQ